MKIGRYSAVLIAVAAFATFVCPSVAGATSTTAIPTDHVSANGGMVTWAVTVPGYGWCTWWSSPRVPKFNKTQRCEGKTERSAKLMPNIGATPKHYTFRLTFLGKKTKTTDWMKLTEAGRTTTSPPATSSYCVGPPSKCFVALPTPDVAGLTAFTIGYVDQNVACPDPGVCDQPAGDQLDVLVMAMTAGPSGMADPGTEAFNFALILPDGGQAHEDSITCDNSVEYALCGLGPEGPGSTFGAEIFFDVPIGMNWTSVNFSYYSSLGSKVYVFTK
jgi:hypothetical protein